MKERNEGKRRLVERWAMEGVYRGLGMDEAKEEVCIRISLAGRGRFAGGRAGDDELARRGP